MHHITETKSGKFMVVLIGKNGKVLSTTEELSNRRNCFKNIQAQAVQMGLTQTVECQDDTRMEYCIIMPNGKVAKYGRPKADAYLKPAYIPGKNPKKKIRK